MTLLGWIIAATIYLLLGVMMLVTTADLMPGSVSVKRRVVIILAWPVLLLLLVMFQ